VIVIGIDPGLTGGLATIDSRTGKCSVHDLPTTPLEGNGLIRRRIQGRELGLLIRKLSPAGESVAVFLEQVGAMGGKNNAIQTQASLAGTFLGIRCVLDVLQLNAHLVQPQKWKTHFGLKRIPDEKDSAYKARHVALARTLYPDAPLPLAKDHNKAEALLIAHYGLKAVA
jgi:hypothetical protein